MEPTAKRRGFRKMRKLYAGKTMLIQPTPATLAATVIAALFVTAISPSVQAQQPAPQNVPTPPDSAKPKPAAPPADAMPTGDPKTGVLKPPDVDPKMAKAVPDVDPAMNNPPPGTTKAPADAPPAEAKPR
jgi:hypothetical protein